MKTLQTTLVMLAAWTAQSVLAHTELSETAPADQSVVATAPEDLALKFSEPVRLTALAIQQDGEPKQSLGPLPAETTAQFAIALPELTDGHYVVSWRALSEDTHVMSGEFMFAVGASGEHAEHMDQSAMPAGEHSEHTDAGHGDGHVQH